MQCSICRTRRPRRSCPALNAAICPPCCGEAREKTVDCPAHCGYLIEARQREPLLEPDPARIPNADYKLPDRIAEDHWPLLACLASVIVTAVPGITDRAALEALDCLIRTGRTLASGVIYETPPSEPYARMLYVALQQAIQRFRESELRDTGLVTTRDGDVLALLVLVQRFGLTRDNSRPLGRSFLYWLAQIQPPELSASSSSSAILR
jgi:hypothetical protein